VSQGAGGRGSQAPDSGKAIIFRAKAKLFGQSQQPKMEKIGENGVIPALFGIS